MIDEKFGIKPIPAKFTRNWIPISRPPGNYPGSVVPYTTAVTSSLSRPYLQSKAVRIKTPMWRKPKT